jgi:hypothetical protein
MAFLDSNWHGVLKGASLSFCWLPHIKFNHLMKHEINKIGFLFLFFQSKNTFFKKHHELTKLNRFIQIVQNPIFLGL